MKTKIQIKSIWGDVLFEYEKEDNAVKDTLIEAIYVKTLKIWDREGKEIKSAQNGTSDNKILYTVGKITRADKFDDSVFVDCSHGIHFFLTKREAEEW